MAFWTWIGLFGGKGTTKWPKKGDDHGQRGVVGMPVFDPTLGSRGCAQSAAICPTQAIEIQGESVKIDYGKCVNCRLCTDHCESGALRESHGWPVPSAKREELIQLTKKMPSFQEKPGFTRSLHIRHVDAGSCNGCESELSALINPFYDMHRFGIFFTPSPRFADLLLVTGSVTYNMKEPLLEAYQAMPKPCWVMAVGTCAISGGTNGGGYACHHGLEGILPVDLYLPGCPPNPAAILEGLLSFLHRRNHD